MPAILTDFGLAKASATGSKYTRTGEALGTPAYMSPEQARGEPDLGPPTDVWALGCVLYELLADSRPFESDTIAGTVARVLTVEPPPLRRIRPDLPRGVAAVVASALAKVAARRHRDAAELRDDLDRVLRGIRPRRAPARHGVAVAVLAGVVGAAAAIVGVAWPRPPAASSPAPAPAPTPGASVAAKAVALRATDPAGAATLLAEALAVAPDRHDWRIEFGLLRWAVGDAAGARAAWAMVPAGAPEAPRAHLHLALEAFFRANMRDAKADVDAAADGTGRVRALALAIRAATLEDWSGARTAVQGQAGWEAAAVRGYVESCDPAGAPAAAVRAYDEALASGLPFAWLFYNRGLARAGMDDATGAEADYSAALRLDPDMAAAVHNRADLRRAHGDVAGALADYTTELRLDPEDLDTLCSRARLRFESGDLAGALVDWDAAVARAPANAEIRFQRGMTRWTLQDPVGALEDYDATLAAQPDFIEARQNRGAARHTLGDVKGAHADYSAVLERFPENLQARVNRGYARLALGEGRGAVEDFTELLRLDPESGPGRDGLEKARRMAGK